MAKTLNRQWIIAIFSVILLLISSTIHFSTDFLSTAALFSLVSITGPALGAILRPTQMLWVITAYYGLGFLLKDHLSLSVGVFYAIPTWAAAMTVRYAEPKDANLSELVKDSLLRVGIPLVALACFLLHPVARLAAPYALFWLIPIASFILDRVVSKKMFASSSLRLVVGALAATFVAHACGSIFCLYLNPTMTKEMWLNLIPVVVIERMTFATGIALAALSLRAVFGLKAQNSLETKTI